MLDSIAANTREFTQKLVNYNPLLWLVIQQQLCHSASDLILCSMQSIRSAFECIWNIKYPVVKSEVSPHPFWVQRRYEMSNANKNGANMS